MSLYNKYRPRIFSEVLGQEHVVRPLRNAAINNSLSHAFLFVGSRGTGKTSVARVLSRIVNCLNPKNGEPCNVCKSCSNILNGITPDVVEVDAASNRGIDDVLAIIERASFSPMELKKKVHIIDEIYQLTPSAKDALLKIIEEPPSHVMFILATTEAHKVPSTIRSRCQKFDFVTATILNIIIYLKSIADKEKIKYSDIAVSSIAKLANGSFRDGVTLLENVIAWSNNIDDVSVRSTFGIPQQKHIQSAVKAILCNDKKAILENSLEWNISYSSDMFITSTIELLYETICQAIINDKPAIFNVNLDVVIDTMKHLAITWKAFDIIVDTLALELVLLDSAFYVESRCKEIVINETDKL